MNYEFLGFWGLLNNWVDDFSKPITELKACKNVFEREVWALTKVPWYTSIWSDWFSWLSVDKLHYYYRPSTWAHLMVWWADSWTDYILKYRTTSNWTTLTTLSDRAWTNLSMANYLDRAFIVWYRSSDNSFDEVATISWTTYSTSDSNLNNMPQGRFLFVYDWLLYVAHAKIWNDVFPSRVYWNEDPVWGAITWNNSVNFRELGNNDWDMITGLWEAGGKLVILKNASIWVWDEYTSYKIADVWCIAEKSVAKLHWAVYWINKEWVWRFAWGNPQLISRKVQKFIDNMSNSNFINSVWVKYENEYRIFVWDVTVDGYLYSNTWLCFDSLKETWYVRCTSHVAYSAITYIENWEDRTYFWTTGWVEKFAARFDTVFSDDWNEIDSFFITNDLHFDAPSVVKYNPTMTVYSKNPQWMRLYCEADSSWTSVKDWDAILRRNIEKLDLMVTWNYFSFKFHEKSLNKPWTFRWFTIDVKELENIKK